MVENGALAVEAWQAEAWDVILMDLQRPVMDGMTATRAIRAEAARTGRGRTPIMAMTANVMAHQVAEYRAIGMDGLVGKPVVVEDLFQTLRALSSL